MAGEFPGLRIEYRIYGSCDPMEVDGCEPTGTRLDLINAKYDIARVIKMQRRNAREAEFTAYVLTRGRHTIYDREGHKSTVPATIKGAMELDPARNCAIGIAAPPDAPISARNFHDETFHGEKAIVSETPLSDGWMMITWRLPEHFCIEVRTVLFRPDAAGTRQQLDITQADSYKLGPVDSDPLWNPQGVEIDPMEFRRLEYFRNLKASGWSDPQIEKAYSNFKNSPAFAPIKAESEAWKRLQAASK